MDQKGDAASAIDNYLIALCIAKESGDRAEEAEVCGSLGMAYRKIANYSKAIHFHEARLDAVHELGDKAAEAGAYLSLALCYYSLERFQKAATVMLPDTNFHTCHCNAACLSLPLVFGIHLLRICFKVITR